LIIPDTPKYKSLAVTLASAPLDPLQSSLQIGSGGGIEKLLLELIYFQRIKSKEDIDHFIFCTLMSVQHSPDMVCSSTVDLLIGCRSGNGSQLLLHSCFSTSSSLNPRVPSQRPLPQQSQQSILHSSEPRRLVEQHPSQVSLQEMPWWFSLHLSKQGKD
jgi:hypothetical protein